VRPVTEFLFARCVAVVAMGGSLFACTTSAVSPADAGAPFDGPARVSDANQDAGRDSRVCSPCRAMTYEECMADLRCEAVPF
jgi:hypothetical protein